MTSYSSDAFPPELMAELQAIRAPFRTAYDVLWRLERAFRYVYWLNHHEHPSFNLIGSWTEPDIRREIDLWEGLRDEGLDTGALIARVTALLEQRFDLSVEAMIARSTDPSLATHSLPIWNCATESLLPQNLGNWRIREMRSYEKPGLGQSYAYRHTSADSTLTLYLYNNGLDNIEPGISDPRFSREVSGCIRDIEALADSTGNKLIWYCSPTSETIYSRHDTPVLFVSSTWLIVNDDGTRQVGALSMTGFRHHLLKIRITGTQLFIESDEGQSDIDSFNLDLADFVEHFGP